MGSFLLQNVKCFYALRRTMKKSVFVISILLLLTNSLSAQDLYDIDTITQIEITFAESNWDYILDSYYAAGDEERLVGSITINGIQFDSVGIRYKGNSSYSPNNVKNPFNIKLDHIIDDQTYQNYGTLKLANGFKDPSFVRETLSYEIARNYMPSSYANYCNVYINEELIGLYTSVQDVDKYFKGCHYPAGEDIRFKGELSGSGSMSSPIWVYLGADSNAYHNYYELKSDYGWSHLIDFLDILNNDPTEIEEVLNVDVHLWMLAFDILMVNLDAPVNVGHNYYLFGDNSGRFNTIIWDLNENLGVFVMLSGGQPLNLFQMQTLDPLLNVNDPDYPIIAQVLSDEKYQKMYIAHMRTIVEEFFENGYYENRANELQNIIDLDYLADPNTFYSYIEFQQNINFTVGGSGPGSHPIVGITQLMDTRVNWLLNNPLFQGTIPDISSPSYSPQTIVPNTLVWINVDVIGADEVYINYRLNFYDKFEELEMFDDGNHNDGAAGDGNYGISVEAGYDNIQYYMYAQNIDQGAFLPERSATEFYEIDVTTNTGNIVLNEINYNSADDFDPEDWVELYNADVVDFDISGWIFKDENDAHIFIIPDNTMLEQGEFLVLCKNSVQFLSLFPGVTNCVGDFDFGLSGGGELIRLFNPEGILVDSVCYDDDDPWPTEPDGNGPTLELNDPDLDNSIAENWHASEDHGTPGEPNSGSISVQDDHTQDHILSLRNYPNPFKLSTNIMFSLQKMSFVELKIFNIKGQVIKILAKDTFGRGEHTILWDGTNENGEILPNGIYFYMIDRDGYQESSKMVLMK